MDPAPPPAVIPAAAASASWRDYYQLCKPNVVLLMLLTAAVGMFMAVPGPVPWRVLVAGNLGIALCAGSAAAVNHLVDRRVGGLMDRTPHPPVAWGGAGGGRGGAV